MTWTGNRAGVESRQRVTDAPALASAPARPIVNDGQTRRAENTGLFDRLTAMSPDALQGALIALDEVSRPLTAREIEAALRRHGVPRSRAVIAAAALRNLNIIAVVGGENHD